MQPDEPSQAGSADAFWGEASRAVDPRALVTDYVYDVILVAGADEKYIWVSPSAEIVLGWKPSELVGRTFREFIHPEDLPHLLAEREAAGTNTADGATE